MHCPIEGEAVGGVWLMVENVIGCVNHGIGLAAYPAECFL